MSATRPILTAVRDYLAAELPAYTVELFPDDPAGYRFMAPLGAVLVGYQGSKFARPDGLGLIGQQRDVTLALTVFGRGLNHDGAALDLLDALRLAITGYRPPDCEPCHLISEQFLAEEGGAWQYQLIAQTETQQVERRPADIRPKVSSLYLRQQGAGIGAQHGIQRGLQAGRYAVADDLRQYFIGQMGPFGDMQELQLQKLAHIFGKILSKQRYHLAQRRFGQTFGIIRRGGEAGKAGGQTQASHLFGMARSHVQRHQPAERPAHHIAVVGHFGRQRIGGGHDVERAVRRRVTVSGQVGRMHPPGFGQQRAEAVEYTAVCRPAVD